MKAMVLTEIGDLSTNPSPLSLQDLPLPPLKPDEVLIKVSVCGVCHTELDEIEGRTPPAFLPIVPGHQVVGTVIDRGSEAHTPIGTRVGVAWIFDSCGECIYCLSGRENLCPQFRATGRDAHGGYAETMIAREAFIHTIPENLSDSAAAPMLCAGAIGYRSLRLAEVSSGKVLGLAGFGASAHLVLKLVRYRWPDVRVIVFARNPAEQEFARSLGAVWAGGFSDLPPEPVDSIIDTTPVWKPVVSVLPHLKPGGRLVINAIRKENTDRSALLDLDYACHLWMEKEIKSVANVTRTDVREFLKLAAEASIVPEIREFSLADANHALQEMKQGGVPGAKVLRIG
ncbi:MAG TPA: alcohol dehydrogenase [Anaerolinea thermolimosa]|uniref:alcohol dehydrogenase n=1 Tax=Anaerolinea thermolimosa TaxID=229919 RepID=A0A3D1JGH0_9CHLR|nr:zinc-dependent alcohol dehydrogenase family protein [Anaerolinea thermolimosa]GAP06904.1 Zn-dependent alcohol dehydrogenases [Anaerolinea thermolimosa]HCE17583.1 alcohol dehydrogenase [Anaerolinea thermolimosa]